MNAPDDLDGRDISPAVNGERIKDHPVFCDALTPRWGAGTAFRSIRYKSFKYVRFRDAVPLFFDIDKDPKEQQNLITRGIPAYARQDYEFMKGFADESIDFDAAEKERTERDGALSKQYALKLAGGESPDAFMNLYTLPDKRVVAADDILYHPRIAADNFQETFAV